jgi:hypothetical protein
VGPTGHGRRTSGCVAARSPRGHAGIELGKIAGECRHVLGVQQFYEEVCLGSPGLSLVCTKFPSVEERSDLTLRR